MKWLTRWFVAPVCMSSILIRRPRLEYKLGQVPSFFVIIELKFIESFRGKEMKIVTSTDIKEYVEKDKKNAESYFPEIIRKLINNTVDNITKFILPTKNNIIETGPDGILQYHGNNKYLGDKFAIIEIGTNKDYKNKANQDIEKRKKMATKKGNFIFITPYLYTDRKTSKEK